MNEGEGRRLGGGRARGLEVESPKGPLSSPPGEAG